MRHYNQTNGMLTIQEVAELLHVHSNTLRRWTDQGMMKAYRVGPRGDRRFRAEDVDVFLLGERNVVPVVVNK
jgi:excisionase family DNA binding protein